MAAPQLVHNMNLKKTSFERCWEFPESSRDVHITKEAAVRNWTAWGAHASRALDNFGVLMDMTIIPTEDNLTRPEETLEVLHGMLCECPDGALEKLLWKETAMWQPRKTSVGGYVWPACFFGGTFKQFMLNIRK